MGFVIMGFVIMGLVRVKTGICLPNYSDLFTSVSSDFDLVPTVSSGDLGVPVCLPYAQRPSRITSVPSFDSAPSLDSSVVLGSSDIQSDLPISTDPIVVCNYS